MTTPTNKEDAEKVIDALLVASNKAIQDAMEIADKFGLKFRFEPDYIGSYYGAGGEAPSSLGVSEGEWYPSSWSASSIYC